MKKKILCISDSLGLPRPLVDYEHTWFYMLKSKLVDYELIPYFRRGATTDSLADSNYGETLFYYNPDIIVLQLGICDCSPRYMKRNSLLHKIIIRLPSFLQNPFWKIYKKIFQRNLKRADVTPDRFQCNITNYFDKCQDSGIEKLIIVKIATPAPAMMDRNKTVMEAVDIYNSIYEKVASNYSFIEIINPLSISNDDLYTDGYHPNLKGNMLITSTLHSKLSNNG